MSGESEGQEDQGLELLEGSLSGDDITVPKEVAILPLKDTVVFPETMLPLGVGQERSVQLIDDVLGSDKLVGLFAERDEFEGESAGFDDIYQTGCLGKIHRMMRMPDGSIRVLVQGAKRIKIEKGLSNEPYLTAKISPAEDKLEDSIEMQALVHKVSSLFGRLLSHMPSFPDELQVALANIDNPVSLSHLVSSTLRVKVPEKQELLEQSVVEKRLRTLTGTLTRELEVFELGDKIQSEVKSQMDKSQREYFLRQQLKAIQDELGESDEATSEVDQLREKLNEADLPDNVQEASDRELAKLSKLSQMAADWSVIRTYLDWIADLPWNKYTEDKVDIEDAKRILDEDHFDLEKVKDRILEYLSVRKLRDQLSGPILCFVGPPGVGKTSLGQSIARALGREFIRISVGGVRDEAEIRGHRRTYVGALPGTVLRALRDAGSSNPVFMMDEVDKIGTDAFRGDPASALLEVLDPEQNDSFRDHYLDLPYDLSKVLFITTANTLDTVPPALRDRMEVIRLAGYTEEEKVQIARKYLVPRQLVDNGLEEGRAEFTDAAVLDLAKYYTKEAGLRNLERSIGAVCRKLARKYAEGDEGPFKVDDGDITTYIGKRIFLAEAKRRTSTSGVATGLAWTQAGGDILFIESVSMPGSGKLSLTGQLGSVMKESAEAALSFTRSISSSLGVKDDFFKKNDLHVHIPAGAIPKDGPSAGVTMATSIVSMLTDRPVDSGLAMTGEITLTGQVLPVGGIKEKVLAAKRAGISKILMPAHNQNDAEEDIPPDLRENLELVYVDRIEEVLNHALALDLPFEVPEPLE